MHKRRTTNEWEFQGEVLNWLNEEIRRRSGMGLNRATQEASKVTPKRNDLVVWWNRAAESAFLTIELKTPTTPINDPKLLSDGHEKAKRWGAPFFAIWSSESRVALDEFFEWFPRIMEKIEEGCRSSALGTRFEDQVYSATMKKLGLHAELKNKELFGQHILD